MAAYEKDLDASEFFHSALDTLMDNLHLNSSPSMESTRCSNSFGRHFKSVDEDKFFSFCSTIKKHSKSDKATSKNKSKSAKQQNEAANNSAAQNVRETPKRSMTATRKQKLFESTETLEEFKPKSRSSLNEKELSPQSLLLKKAITRFECMQRRQERMALSKKPMRTSLRI